MILKSNAEELASIAQRIGAEVIRGPVRYPGVIEDSLRRDKLITDVEEWLEERRE